MRDNRPLAGVRVIDAATYIAAPFCATLLAEFGAEVIKVEMPGVGDPLRAFGHVTEAGDSLIWLSEGRNKKSVTIDLRTKQGADIFKKLSKKCDVICENFQTGTLEKWGVGYETLKALNPGLIMMRITGYGQTGPYAGRPGFGRIGNAFGGLSYLAGYPDRAPVTPGSATLPDYLSGVFGAFGVMLALRARERTGEGQVIDIGLYESIFRILDELAPAYDRFGIVRERMGPGTVNAVPHSHYQTRDGRWVAIACTSDRIFARLAALMGRPEIAGEGKYGRVAQRVAARAELDDVVQDWARGVDRDELLVQCDQAQVPCGPLYSIDEIFRDRQYRARRNIVEVDDERTGPLPVPNVVPRLTGTPGGIDHLGPALGADIEEVFGSLLGLGADEIEKLKQANAI